MYESLVSVGLALEPTARAAGGGVRLHREGEITQPGRSRLPSAPAHSAPRVAGKATEAVHRLRQELNWHYRQSELEEVRREKRSVRRLRRVTTADSCARKTVEPIARRDPPDGRGILGAPERRSRRPRGDSLEPRTRHDPARVLPGPGADLRLSGRSRCSSTSCPWVPSRTCGASCGCCSSSSSKFRLGPDYVGAFAEQLQAATDAHLRELHAALIAPIRDRLQAAHLVVVPHDVLHVAAVSRAVRRRRAF